MLGRPLPDSRDIAPPPLSEAAASKVPLTLVASRNRSLPPPPSRSPLGKILVQSGALSPGDLLTALAMQQREDARLGEILLAHGMITPPALMAGLAQQWGGRIIHPVEDPPDPRLVDLYGPANCLRDAILPWRRQGSFTVIVTARPHLFARHHEALTAMFGPVVMALAQEADVFRAVEQIRAASLTHRAETIVPTEMSCRDYVSLRKQRVVLALLLAALAVTIAFPQEAFVTLCAWAVVTLVLQLALKNTAGSIALWRLWAARRARLQQVRNARAVAASALTGAETTAPFPGFTSRRARPAIARLPMVSVMVPLFREDEIATRLVARLERLTYPKELLDVVLVMEAEDDTTRAMLARTTLPPWIRVITVPAGAVQTKPRALNYALEFCRGSIIGVWDAEDAPEPEQLHKVVRRFHERPREVGCLQGALDFYNARTNWLSRCFAVEYASWFRVVLPGLSRMGLAIPLGGTTLFFRREALEAVGGWDAHNVTEDADLGMRLARMGYRAELVESTTYEEANCRALPWVKQRSRWLKGYALTWAVHMRNPFRLWRELGAWKFAGFQLLFLGTLSQFLLAPLLWSFWLVAFGLWHPLLGVLPPWAFWALGGLFFTSELSTIAIGILGVRQTRHSGLGKWVPTLHLYYPLGALASYKAFYEIVTKPFYWDKTAHGLHDEDHSHHPA